MGDLRFEVLAVCRIDLRGNLDRHASVFCNLDGTVYTLFRRDTAKKRQVLAGLKLWQQQIVRKPMVDSARPVGPDHGFTLGVRDGNQRHFSELLEQRMNL